MTVHVLMVCMGNICRSPTAEAVLRHKLKAAGLEGQVIVDSAGTHGWHQGDPPDPRSIAHARRRGFDLSAQRSRPLTEADFERFDLILAMDWDNLKFMERRCSEVHRGKLGRLTSYGQKFRSDIVPDPYQGGAAGFDQVLDLIEDACDGLVVDLQRKTICRMSGTS